jgi:REG-2-like HAD superfamily hydrolase
MWQPFEIVFVDVTDTLLRVRGSVGAIYAPAARELGFEATPDDIDAAFRDAISSAPPPCFPPGTPQEHAAHERRWWHDVVSRTFAGLGPFPRFEEFFTQVFELFRTTAPWELFPGAPEALAELRAGGRRLGIVSDIDARVFDVLAGFGLRDLFEPIVLSSRAGRSKRDGGLFPLALAAAGVRPGAAVHVGDSLQADVYGAHGAGVAAIWFSPEPRDLPGISIARDWGEVVMRVRELEARRNGLTPNP